MCVVRWLIAVFTLCLVLAGCSRGGGEPNSSKLPTAILPGSTTASASPSRTGPLTTGANVKPGELPPSMSAVAVQHTSNGAQAFAAYFYAALDWSLATNDSYLLVNMSESSCGPCQNYINSIGGLASSGSRLNGGRIHVTQVGLDSGTLVPADYVIHVTLTQEPEVLTKSGSAPSTLPAPPASIVNRLYVSWRDGHWLVLEIGIPAS